MKRYYLAYGSNLNVKQMKARCPGAKIVGTAVIRDYELLFKGSKTGAYLTIEPKKGSFVPVGVWEVTAEDELRLDRYEGYPSFYYKKEMQITVENKRCSAFVYIMHEDRPIGVPSQFYMKTCLDGYKDFGFDTVELMNAYIRCIEAHDEE